MFEPTRTVLCFGHPSGEKLIKTSLKSGFSRSSTENLVRIVNAECENCLRTGRPSSRPVVCSASSSDFNDVVAIDISFFEGRVFLKIIDLMSRYGVTVVIPDKTPRSVIAAIDRYWIRELALDSGIGHNFGFVG